MSFLRFNDMFYKSDIVKYDYSIYLQAKEKHVNDY
jgi:hypothetical protein